MLSSINSFVALTRAVILYATSWQFPTVGLLPVYSPASSVQYATIEFVIVEMFFVSVHIGIILAYLLTTPASVATLKTSLANSSGTMYPHSLFVPSFKYVALTLATSASLWHFARALKNAHIVFFASLRFDFSSSTPNLIEAFKFEIAFSRFETFSSILASTVASTTHGRTSFKVVSSVVCNSFASIFKRIIEIK
jgi:hypothetical protein